MLKILFTFCLPAICFRISLFHMKTYIFYVIYRYIMSSHIQHDDDENNNNECKSRSFFFFFCMEFICGDEAKSTKIQRSSRYNDAHYYDENVILIFMRLIIFGIVFIILFFSSSLLLLGISHIKVLLKNHKICSQILPSIRRYETWYINIYSVSSLQQIFIHIKNGKRT